VPEVARMCHPEALPKDLGIEKEILHFSSLWLLFTRCNYGSSRNKNGDNGTVGPGGKHPGLALT